MAQFYEMPAVSPTMEVGTIVAWKVKEGEKFVPQTVVAEIGTDKANMEAEIFDAGVMIKHLLAEGDEAPAGFPIAIVGQSADEDITALLAEFETKKSGAAKPKDDAKPAKEAPAAEADVADDTKADTTGAPPKAEEPKSAADAPKNAEVTAAKAAPSGNLDRTWNDKVLSKDFQDPPGDRRYGTEKTAARVVASPLARAVAQDLGVDLGKVQGTGPGGRVVREDVEAAAKAPKPAPGVAASRADESVRNSPMRKTIAKRLLQSHQDIPTFFLTVAFDGQGFVALRDQLKAREVKVSYNDILTACVARALRESPKVNASWSDKEIVRYGRVDVGIAVALPDGLITPVLRDADAMTLTQISSKTRELVGRAKEGKLDQSEYTGGTFTISNLGMYEIDQFTAIINPPEAAILAVGSLAQVPVIADGQLAVGWRMKCTLTCDHRVVDGATGAEFLQVLRKYVETPVLLLA